jgi:hypothetical protein
VLFDFPTWEGASFFTSPSANATSSHKKKVCGDPLWLIPALHSEHGTNSNSGTEFFCDRSILCIIRGDPLVRNRGAQVKRLTAVVERAGRD